ncbi:hypothetical protein ACLOJK_003564 [Asimina triloba]
MRSPFQREKNRKTKREKNLKSNRIPSRKRRDLELLLHVDGRDYDDVDVGWPSKRTKALVRFGRRRRSKRCDEIAKLDCRERRRCPHHPASSPSRRDGM